MKLDETWWNCVRLVKLLLIQVRKAQFNKQKSCFPKTAKVAKLDVKCEHLESCTEVGHRSSWTSLLPCHEAAPAISASLPDRFRFHKFDKWKRGKHPTFVSLRSFRTISNLPTCFSCCKAALTAEAFPTLSWPLEINQQNCCSRIQFQQFAKTTFHQSWVSWSCLCGRFSSIVSCAWLSWNATLSYLVTLGKVFQPGHIQTEAAAIASGLAGHKSSEKPEENPWGTKKTVDFPFHTSATLQVGAPTFPSRSDDFALLHFDRPENKSRHLLKVEIGFFQCFFSQKIPGKMWKNRFFSVLLKPEVGWAAHHVHLHPSLRCGS